MAKIPPQVALRVKAIGAALIAFVELAVFPQKPSLSAVFLGFAVTYFLTEQKYPAFSVEKVSPRNLGTQAAKCALGGIIALALFAAFGALASLAKTSELTAASAPLSSLYELARYVQNAVFGAALACAPLLFSKVGLHRNLG
jgi:hypothetical protein